MILLSQLFSKVAWMKRFQHDNVMFRCSPLIVLHRQFPSYNFPCPGQHLSSVLPPTSPTTFGSLQRLFFSAPCVPLPEGLLQGFLATRQLFASAAHPTTVLSSGPIRFSFPWMMISYPLLCLIKHLTEAGPSPFLGSVFGLGVLMRRTSYLPTIQGALLLTLGG